MCTACAACPRSRNVIWRVLVPAKLLCAERQRCSGTASRGFLCLGHCRDKDLLAGVTSDLGEIVVTRSAPYYRTLKKGVEFIAEVVEDVAFQRGRGHKGGKIALKIVEFNQGFRGYFD